MEELKTIIKEKRPHLAPSSLKTYASILKGLYYSDEDNKDKKIVLDWFKDEDKVLPLLTDKPPHTRKTLLAAIIVLLDGKAPEEYTKMMYHDKDEVKEEYQQQKKTAKQEENWISYEDVVELWNAKYRKVKPILYNNDAKDKKEIRTLVEFMVQTITCGIFFEPRRSEWVSVKVKDYDPKTDNYLDQKLNCFVLQKYKTSKAIGTEKIPYPKEFKAILSRYLKFVDNEYLIFNSQDKQMTQVNLAQMLNKIYDKNISTSMLRHIYLTHKFKDIPALAELKDVAKKMGQVSIEQMLEYVKT
jgi:site-specific recombinase XerD